jgi:hypothetical protein
MVFDPERMGYVLQRLPPWRLKGSGKANDFQDLPLWRTLTVLGIRAARTIRPTVIVPMAFSNLAYLDEIRRGVGAFEPDVRHVCLVAPFEVVQERVRRRGSDGPRGAWQHQRALECCEAHQRPEFREHIPTANRSTQAIVDDLVARLGVPQISQPLTHG